MYKSIVKLLVIPLLMSLSQCTNGTDSSEEDLPESGILISTGSREMYKCGFNDNEWYEINFDGVLVAYEFFVHPDNNSYVTAISDGGIHFSENGGNSWAESDDGLYLEWFGWAQDFKDKNILYAGGRKLLETNMYVARSTDFGETWSVLCQLPFQSPYGIYSMVAHPTKQGLLFAGTREGGILQSSDGGENWTQSNSGMPSGNNTFVWDLAVNPFSGMLYATVVETVVVQGVQLPVNMTYTSLDQGKSWTKVSEGESFRAIYGTEPNYSTLYGIIDNELFKSIDKGGSWEKIAIPNAPRVSSIFLDQKDFTLYVSTIQGLYTSIDDGKTFTCFTANSGDVGNQSIHAAAAIHVED